MAKLPFMKDEVLRDYWRTQLYAHNSDDPIFTILWRNVKKLPDPARFRTFVNFIDEIAHCCNVHASHLLGNVLMERLLLHTYNQGEMRRDLMEGENRARLRRQLKRAEDAGIMDEVHTYLRRQQEEEGD